MTRSGLFVVVLLSSSWRPFLVVEATTTSLCPSTLLDIANLNPWTSCIVTPTLGLSANEAASYFDSSAPATCINGINACANAIKFDNCPVTTEQLMSFFVSSSSSSSAAVQCASFFNGLSQFCDQPFGNLMSLYCPVPPPVSGAAIGGIVAAILFMIFLVSYVWWRTKRSILLDREIEAAIAFSGIGTRYDDEKLIQASNPHAVVNGSPKSRYRGVEWNGRTWDAVYQTPTVREVLGTFATEEEAARKYDARIVQLRNAGATRLPTNFSSSPTSQPENNNNNTKPTPKSPNMVLKPKPDVPTKPVAEPPAVKPGQVVNVRPPPGLHLLPLSSSKRKVSIDPNRERHVQELISFYEYYDPGRENIEALVISLFEKYNFRGLARALLRKYGVLPAGWELEYDATRSIAMSMAVKLFGNSRTSSDAASLPRGHSIAIRKDTVPDF